MNLKHRQEKNSELLQDDALRIQDGSIQHPQSWHFPSRLWDSTRTSLGNVPYKHIGTQANQNHQNQDVVTSQLGFKLYFCIVVGDKVLFRHNGTDFTARPLVAP